MPSPAVSCSWLKDVMPFIPYGRSGLSSGPLSYQPLWALRKWKGSPLSLLLSLFLYVLQLKMKISKQKCVGNQHQPGILWNADSALVSLGVAWDFAFLTSSPDGVGPGPPFETTAARKEMEVHIRLLPSRRQAPWRDTSQHTAAHFQVG